MIEIQNLSKHYGEKIALNNLNLKINGGEIFGLIGHNGAGKSTTIKSLVSVINPTSGEIFIDKLNLKENRFECKKKLYYIPDNPDMFLTMAPIEYWSLIADVFELSSSEKEERIAKYSKLFKMENELHSPIESFSHGMRQKTFIIAALIANPKIWIMDEPLTGLDPQAAFDLKSLMKEHTQKGNTVLFSTHVLEVAEHLCDRIGILSKGNLIFVGTLDELREKFDGDSLESIYLNIIKNIDNESEE
ncbi:ABC transporter ATP-binding protein [Gemelliphila palaticanis]|uniref:ABC transporter ATP-binding protein n=1 Tax=Gemelliphila palaticanis TaxID=81950 RepID=A0ABX2SYX2_9BACL|nr:ABC transporter ATP-binding protein [Gemella palaticanis]MBF0715519.1 ABC transporter ATP-binding protein [Gemella palaticanis]NYS47449.1 ABC transporter ATP-binding protein [Gemella palaticanis]